MFKKNVAKRIVFCLMAFAMLTTSVIPAFATENNSNKNEESDISRFEKTEYENQYGKNGQIDMINVPGYDESYELTNEIYLGSNVVMYLITQNLFEIDDSSFKYDFEGTMNAKNEYCDMGFSFDIGLLENKRISSTEEFKCGEKANIRSYQFSVYPGFYNFYNEGMNGFWSSNNEVVVMRTLTPDFNLSEKDSYLTGKDAWVEVKPNDTARIYVMIGTKEWYDKATKDVVAFAMDIEKSVYNSEIENAESNEEVEVNVDEEKLTEIIEDKEVVVETEEVTNPNFESAKPQEVVEQKEEPNIIKYVIIVFVILVISVIGYNVYKKITKPTY